MCFGIAIGVPIFSLCTFYGGYGKNRHIEIGGVEYVIEKNLHEWVITNSEYPHVGLVSDGKGWWQLCTDNDYHGNPKLVFERTYSLSEPLETFYARSWRKAVKQLNDWIDAQQSKQLDDLLEKYLTKGGD